MRTLVASIVLIAVTQTGSAAEGAKVQQVDKNGNPVGKPISLPDCKSCKVEQTGPNQYNVTVPKNARQKADAAADKAQEKK